MSRDIYGTTDQVQGLRIKAGSRIKINHRTGTYIGTVRTAANYPEGGRDNWYIELDCEPGAPCGEGYTYWKQRQDGGTVELMGPKAPELKKFEACDLCGEGFRRDYPWHEPKVYGENRICAACERRIAGELGIELEPAAPPPPSPEDKKACVLVWASTGQLIFAGSRAACQDQLGRYKLEHRLLLEILPLAEASPEVKAQAAHR